MASEGWWTPQTFEHVWRGSAALYGTFGIMVRLCSDAETSNPIIAAAVLAFPALGFFYSLDWAKLLIKGYKRVSSAQTRANSTGCSARA